MQPQSLAAQAFTSGSSVPRHEARILRELLGTRWRARRDKAYASMALPQPDGEPEVLGTAAAAVVDDWAAARPATPRRRAAEKRMFAVDLV